MPADTSNHGSSAPSYAPYTKRVRKPRPRAADFFGDPPVSPPSSGDVNIASASALPIPSSNVVSSSSLPTSLSDVASMSSMSTPSSDVVLSPSPPTPSSSLPTSPSSIDVYSSAGPFVQGSSKDSQIDTPSIPEAPSKNIPDMKIVVKMLDKMADGVVDTDALLAELCSYCMQRMDHAREAENFIRDVIREKILELQTKPKEDILEHYFSDSEASSDSQEPGLSTPSLAAASPQNLDQEEPESIASTRTSLDNDLNIATSVIDVSDESNTLSREPLADSSYAIK